MIKNIIYITIIGFILSPFTLEAQEFTIKKSPEEIKRAAEIAEEKEYLTFQEHFFNALQEKAKEDHGKAIEELEKCMQIYPDDLGLNFELAKNYLALKDFENAVFFDEKALEKKPKNHHILEHLKKIYRKQRDFDKAIEVQNRIIAINPKKKQDLIMLYISNRERDKAKVLFTKLKNSHVALNNETYYQRVLFPKKRTPKNIVKATKIKNISNQVEGSISQLQNDFKKNKNYKTLKQLLVKEEKQNNYSQLATDSKLGLELFPAQPYLYLMQGKAEIKLAKNNNAIEVLKAGLDYIIDDNELTASFYKQIAMAYVNLGNQNEATKYLNKITQLNKTK